MSETLRLTPTSIDPELTVDAIEAERQRQVVVRQALTQELPVEVRKAIAKINDSLSKTTLGQNLEKENVESKIQS
jgi:predicted transcriptional regulator